ncbi:MAG: hypothetical protein ACKVPJ_04950 [Chitinophagales bacterium]
MKHFYILFLLGSSLQVFSQGVKYSVSEGSAIGPFAGYVKLQHETLDSYMQVVSDSLQLTSPLFINKAIPFGFEYVTHMELIEFEGGIEFLFTSDEQLTPNGSKVKFTNNTLGIKAGLNIFPIRFAFAGLSFSANANSGKILLSESDTADEVLFLSHIEDQPGELANPFLGYSFTMRLQAGINIPVSKETYTVIRLTPFYDLGLNQFNFYKAFDQRLINYDGEEKTKVKGLGVRMSVLFGLNG